jgi:hypothetical protein
MKRQEIPYRMPDGSTNWQQPGSQAHQLHTEGKTKQLADHMKDVQRRHDALAKPCALVRLSRTRQPKRLRMRAAANQHLSKAR